MPAAIFRPSSNGTAASSLLEAEVVSADGQVRIANACTNPDLFWALKGGGGGTFGVVTRLTLKTHELADRGGAAIFTVKAMSGPAFREVIRKFIAVYAERLFNPHWGGRIFLRGNDVLAIETVSRGLDKAAAQAVSKTPPAATDPPTPPSFPGTHM